MRARIKRRALCLLRAVLMRRPTLWRVARYLNALRHIGQPGPVMFPMELLGIGAKLLSRGLLNTLALDIRHDWLLPFWLRRQLDPSGPAYVPRAMNPFLINQTHRNWTAVGLPGHPREVVVDPRGMVTPWFDGWSLDVSAIESGCTFAPCEIDHYEQTAARAMPLIEGKFSTANADITTRTWVEISHGNDVLMFVIAVTTKEQPFYGQLNVHLRPFNPEGIYPVHELTIENGRWIIDGSPAVLFDRKPDGCLLSDFRLGDAARGAGLANVAHHHCEAGLLTATAQYFLTLEPNQTQRFRLVATTAAEDQVALPNVTPSVSLEREYEPSSQVRQLWAHEIASGMQLQLPDAELQRAFELSRLWLLLMDDGNLMHPGPLTYHHHWFRDSAYLISSLARCGFLSRVPAKLEHFLQYQDQGGYFVSQKGEWDSNGQVLWTIMEYYRLSRDRKLLTYLFPAMLKAEHWLERMRVGTRTRSNTHWGLLPAGFSAEHFGPNDYYLWDNFWGLAGMRDSAEAALELGLKDENKTLLRAYRSYRRDLDRVLAEIKQRTGRYILPSAPLRSPDAASIGGLAADYPLQLMSADDPWIHETVEYLWQNHLWQHGFFHSITHSGVNAYLTCHLAQCLLGMGDMRVWELVRGLLKLASPVMTWPEAIHPLTNGGCMGDGMHGWASAEWLLLLRSLVIRETPDALHLTPCFPLEWLEQDSVLRLCNAPTRFGTIAFDCAITPRSLELTYNATWRQEPINLFWTLPKLPSRLWIDGQKQKVSGCRVNLPLDQVAVVVEFDEAS